MRFFVRRDKVITLASLSLVFLAACSRPVTCAVEGCVSDDRVTLASDAIAAQEADARAETQSEAEKKFNKIFSRLDLIEALNDLQAKGLELLEGRIKALEDKDLKIDAALGDLLGRVSKSELDIKANADALLAAEIDLGQQISDLAKKQQDDFDFLKDSLDDLDKALDERISKLEGDVKTNLGTLNTHIENTRKALCDLGKEDKAIRLKLQQDLDLLYGYVDAEVEKLEGADRTNLQNITKDMRALDKKIDAVALAGVLAAVGLQGQIIGLRTDVNKLDNREKDHYNELKGKIKEVKDKLDPLAASLVGVDKSILGRVSDLETKQGQLRTDLNALDKRVEDYKKAQADINTQLAGDISLLNTNIGTLRSDLQGQINNLDSRLDTLEPIVSGLSTSVSTLKTEMLKAQDDIKAIFNSMATDTELASSLVIIRKELSDEVLKLNNAIDLVKASIPTGAACTLSAELHHGKKPKDYLYYRNLTCGNQTAEVLVDHHDDDEDD